LKITKGYWINYWEPQHQLYNDNFIRSSCLRFDNDGISRVYHFKKDGSVDTSNCERNTHFDIKWKYSNNDSIFKYVGKNGSMKHKVLKLKNDTIILKFYEKEDVYNKGDIVYFVKYSPKSVPIYVEGTVVRF